MSMQNLLQDKTAVVYGAGPIGSAVAMAFAEEGARVFVADLHLEAAQKLADTLVGAGGVAEAFQVDALDKQSIEAFIASVVQKTGRLDVSFNAINVIKGGEQGRRLVDLDYEDFAMPITVYTKTQFLTANAVTPQMVKQGSGVIMMITAIASRMAIPGTVGFSPAWAAMEALCRTLAVELGPHGVRTVCLHSTGSPETADSIGKTFHQDPAVMQHFMDSWAKRSAQHQLLPKSTSLEEVGAMAAFMASDKAGTSTGTIANMSAGMVL
jgi:NAD(P)-dependent dehydrogenase (short-subunit alcohol dehydrogenase family)